MVFTADRDISQGEELVISYDNVRSNLRQQYGFLCNCGGCVGDDYSVDDVKPVARQW